MFNRKSDYALNKKNRESIVYIDTYNNVTLLTVKDFSSEEEFQKWKNWMDIEAHTEEKRDHVHRNHTVSLDHLGNAVHALSGTNYEEDKVSRSLTDQNVLLVQQIRAVLSEKQFRRVWMYFVDEMTLEAIGASEGISHQNVSKSIRSAMKKFQKFFPQAENGVQKCFKIGDR